MNPNLALLILSWQVACLFHENETEKLLEGSTSATEAESDTLDAIHDELTPEVSWDDFNDTYAKFKSAKDYEGVKGGISSVGLEHLPCTQGVKGSSPLFSTLRKTIIDILKTNTRKRNCKETKESKRAFGGCLGSGRRGRTR